MAIGKHISVCASGVGEAQVYLWLYSHVTEAEEGERYTDW